MLAECIGHTEAISAVALSRKRNQIILTGSQDRTIKCWDITNISMLYKKKFFYTIIHLLKI